MLMLVAAVAAVGTGSIYAQSLDIPAWVKNTALFWAQGDISDQDFVAVLQFLINEGIITVPNAPAGVAGAGQAGDVQAECTLTQEHAPPVTIMDATGEHAMSGGFDESSFNSGDPIRVSFETDASQDVGIKVGIFNPTGDLVCTGTITANDFGIARTTFNIPQYYNVDEELEMIAFFQGAQDQKFTFTTTMKGLKTSLEAERITIPDAPQTAIVKLSSAVSEDVRVRVFDSDRELLHEEIVTTNDFGTASIEYTVPKYYLEDEMISMLASFADDPDMVETSVASLIQRTVVDVTISSDKHLYKTKDDVIVLTFTTDPPLTYNDLRILAPTGHAGWCGGTSTHYIDVIEGVGTLEIETFTGGPASDSQYECHPSFEVTSPGFTPTDFKVAYE